MMMQATPPPQPAPTAAVMTVVSKDTETDGGELFSYLFTPNPEVSSILTLPPGGKTEWMAHAVQVYIYVLEGTLTVEFEGGHRLSFKAGQAFLQARTKWHQGLNLGTKKMRFLGVLYGAKGVPNVLNPPSESTAPRER